jgi:predicted nucleic acid-binding protein
VTILDSFAVIALLKGEPAAAAVRELIEGGGCALTTLGVAEVIDHLVRVVGVTDEDAVLDVAQLDLDAPHHLDDVTATMAALIRARHYNRKTRAVSMADCVAAQVARAKGAAVATSVPHLLDLCRDESVGYIALPDSHGEVWSP